MKKIILISIVVGTLSCCKKDNIDIEKDYLSLNYSVIDTSNSGFDFSTSFSEDYVENISIIFTAERHGVSINKKLQFQFLKYFIEKYNFKYILAELPLSHAEILNKYIVGQDDKILSEYYTFLKGTYEVMNENFAFWQKLGELNNILPENKKIRIIGVDMEFQPGLAIKWIRENYLDDQIPDEIQSYIELLKNADIYDSNDNNLRELCKQIIYDINDNSLIYKQYFGNNFSNTKSILDNVINVGLAYEKYPQDQLKWNNFRDSIITKNFLKIDSTILDAKYIGQWGMQHTFQSTTITVNWFASNLQQIDRFYGKISSCVFCYENSNYRDKSGEIEYLNTQPRPGYYSFANTEEPIIFNLINEDSPYSKDLYNITGELNQENSGVTTDYFQYLIIIQNGKPSTIYE